jgi:hypothetical protein
LGNLLIEPIYGAVGKSLVKRYSTKDSRFLVGVWHDSSLSTSVAGLVEQWVR